MLPAVKALPHSTVDILASSQAQHRKIALNMCARENTHLVVRYNGHLWQVESIVLSIIIGLSYKFNIISI